MRIKEKENVLCLCLCLFVGSMVTPLPRLVAGSHLRVTTIIIIFIIIIITIITLVGKPSRATDLLGSSFLIPAGTSKGVNFLIWKLWNVFSVFKTCFVRVWMPPMAILCLIEVARVIGPMTCVRMVNACVRMHACACAKLKVE